MVLDTGNPKISNRAEHSIPPSGHEGSELAQKLAQSCCTEQYKQGTSLRQPSSVPHPRAQHDSLGHIADYKTDGSEAASWGCWLSWSEKGWMNPPLQDQDLVVPAGASWEPVCSVDQG